MKPFKVQKIKKGKRCDISLSIYKYVHAFSVSLTVISSLPALVKITNRKRNKQRSKETNYKSEDVLIRARDEFHLINTHL